MLCSNQLSYVAINSCKDQSSRRGAHFPHFGEASQDSEALGARLDIESEMDNVAVLHDVFLALQPPAPGVFCALLALVLNELVITNDFGADKALLEVGVDDRCCFGGGGADFHGPGAHFLHTGGEVGLQTEQVVSGE